MHAHGLPRSDDLTLVKRISFLADSGQDIKAGGSGTYTIDGTALDFTITGTPTLLRTVSGTGLEIELIPGNEVVMKQLFSTLDANFDRMDRYFIIFDYVWISGFSAGTIKQNFLVYSNDFRSSGIEYRGQAGVTKLIGTYVNRAGVGTDLVAKTLTTTERRMARLDFCDQTWNVREDPWTNNRLPTRESDLTLCGGDAYGQHFDNRALSAAYNYETASMYIYGKWTSGPQKWILRNIYMHRKGLWS